MADRLKTAFALFTVCVLTVLVLDLFARGAVLVFDFVQGRFFPSVDVREELPAYDGTVYDVSLLFREERAADRRMYRPYTVWSRLPFQGELIRIDEEGERATRPNEPGAEPGTEPGAPDLEIWMLGGSSTWGVGAPDAETIPSHLAGLLSARHGGRVRVRNLGEIGFVSTQEIVRLLRELQRGRRPDLVIFFDGVNDAAAAALWPAIPGSHMNFFEIRDRFERRGGAPSPVSVLLTRTGIVQLSQRIAWISPFRRPAPEVPWDAPEGPADVQARGRQGVDIWLANRRIVEAFARAYDFDFLFVLQPSLMVGDKVLDSSEEEILASERENAAKLASMEVYETMRLELRRRLASESGLSHRIRDLSDAFRDVERALYFDYVHISGEGNRILAAELSQLIVGRLCAEKGPSVPSKLGRLCAETLRSR